MRVALISDIHGNYVALEAVLADMQTAHIDQVICLGDVATLGPQPCEVVARLKALECPCVMGNHDARLLSTDPNLLFGVAPNLTSTIEWCAKRLTPDDFAFLRSFEPTVPVALDNETKLLCCHGSPRSNTDNIFAVTPAALVDEMLVGQSVPLLATGHTHVQMLRQHNGLLIINAGSVGTPFAQMPFVDEPHVLPWAEYAIVSWENGVLGVDLRRVPIDRAAIRAIVAVSDIPLRDWLLEQYS